MISEIEGYDIKGQLYESSITIILNATSKADGKPYVIKILKRDHPSIEEIARFKHEYEITQLLNGLKIAPAIDYRKIDNTYGIILKKISAPPLSALLNEKSYLSIDDFLILAIKIVEALDEIHAKKIIHKDINPSNLLCDYQNKNITIIDYGLSVDIPNEKVNANTGNQLAGTLPYLSPEQNGRMNREVDYRSDYYSLGVTFYQMLTGKLPFESDDPLELIHFHMAVIPKSPHEINNQIPTPISDIVMKLLEKMAENRYQSGLGLLSDLKKCQSEWQMMGHIESFKLAQHDIYNHFQISEKLYGREDEIKKLLDTYEEILKGKREILFVNGYSGVGKSSLVYEIYKPIVKRHGYFISGKFDQYKKNMPYYALTQAFEELVKKILTESESIKLAFKNNTLDAVGKNAQIMIDVIPTLESIIGKQPDVPVLGPIETQNRFAYVLQSFIQSLSKLNHPLVVFLDDMQWADMSSLKMLEGLLASPEFKYLFIIGSYRNNEVGEFHPLTLTLDSLKKQGVHCKFLTLKPLQLKDIEHLIADTLHQPLDKVTPLAGIFYEKTEGNPFFICQLLQVLHNENLITFKTKDNEWIWDLKKIQQKNITDNVVDLIIEKIHQLDSTTQKILMYASFLGNKFRPDMLSMICDAPSEALKNAISTLQKEKYIIKLEPLHANPLYQFSHDRIQQGAYSSAEEKFKANLHFTIAKIYLALYEKSKDDQKNKDLLFELVNHFNSATHPIAADEITENDIKMIAELNLKAAKLAKSSAAFAPALKYIENAIRCLTPDSWDVNYDFTRDLYIEAIENANLNAEYDTMEQYATIAKEHVKSKYDESLIVKNRALACIAKLEFENALDLLLPALMLLGIQFPNKPSTLRILITLIKAKITLKRMHIPDLLNLPELTDRTIISAVDLLAIAYALTYIMGSNLFPLIVYKNFLLSLKYGNNKHSAHTYISLGIILCGVFHDVELGNQLGETTLAIYNKFNKDKSRNDNEYFKIEFGIYGLIKVWKVHMHELTQKYLELYDQFVTCGNFEYAAYSMAMYFPNFMLSGGNLETCMRQYEPCKANMHRIKRDHAYGWIATYYQTTINLTETVNEPELLIGKEFNETIRIPELIKLNDGLCLFNTYSFKIILSNLYERHDKSLDLIPLTEKYSQAVLSTFASAVTVAFEALTIIHHYKKMSLFSRIKWRFKLHMKMKSLKLWATHCPQNYLNKYILVQAEWERVRKNYAKAEQLYDKAIAISKEYSFTNDEGFANMLAAKFYLEQNKNKIAALYLNEARYCYHLWGAHGLVKHLEKQYSDLFTSKSFVKSYANKDELSTKRTISTTTSSQILDIESIKKSTDIISSTIIFDDLLKKLLDVAIENMGAQRCVLILNINDKYFITAEGNLEGNIRQSSVMQKQLDESILPITLINFVIHSKQLVILNEAYKNAEQFENDIYINHKRPKSILCLPLINKNVLTGALYLENNLIESAFSHDRIEVLNLLSSQMAIAIDNSKLYKNILTLNNQLMQLNISYERFIPHEFFKLLGKSSVMDVVLGDNIEKNMTVMFADIRDFTTFTESTTTQDVFQFINAFLNVMEPIITNHHGFIDKYIGDSIMALFPTSPDDALKCANDMLKYLDAFNEKLLNDKNYHPVQIGIGISTGLILLGTVGSSKRMDGSVISDTVNTASRIQNLTKEYKVPILFSDDTYTQLINPTQFQTIKIDEVQVRGKTKTTVLYSLIIR